VIMWHAGLAWTEKSVFAYPYAYGTTRQAGLDDLSLTGGPPHRRGSHSAEQTGRLMGKPHGIHPVAAYDAPTVAAFQPSTCRTTTGTAQRPAGRRMRDAGLVSLGGDQRGQRYRPIASWPRPPLACTRPSSSRLKGTGETWTRSEPPPWNGCTCTTPNAPTRPSTTSPRVAAEELHYRSEPPSTGPDDTKDRVPGHSGRPTRQLTRHLAHTACTLHTAARLTCRPADITN
jgi:hypothetical protein